MAYDKVYPTVNENVLEYTKNQEDRIGEEFGAITTKMIYSRDVYGLEASSGASLFYENRGAIEFNKNYIVLAKFYNADYGVQQTISYWVNRKFTSTLGMFLSPINVNSEFELYISGTGGERISVRNKSSQVQSCRLELREF